MASLPDKGSSFAGPTFWGAHKLATQSLTRVSVITHEMPEPETPDPGTQSDSSHFLHFFTKLCTLQIGHLLFISACKMSALFG